MLKCVLRVRIKIYIYIYIYISNVHRIIPSKNHFVCYVSWEERSTSSVVQTPARPDNTYKQCYVN